MCKMSHGEYIVANYSLIGVLGLDVRHLEECITSLHTVPGPG